MEKKIVLILLLILGLAVALRAIYLTRGQFIDSETVASTLTMKQTIAQISSTNNYSIAGNKLAGFTPPHYALAELGIIYLAIIPYELTQGVLSIFAIMYLIKMLFTAIAIIFIYLFAKKITSSHYAGILASLVYAISGIGTYSEAFNRWMGDAFVQILVIVSIYLLLLAIEKKKTKYLISSIVIILFGYFLWNGGAYAIASYLFVCTLLVLSIKEKRKSVILLVGSGMVILGLLLVLVILPNVFSGVSSYFGATSFTPKMVGSNLVQMFGQFEPQAEEPSVTYLWFIGNNTLKFKVPYVLWFLAGFFTFGLAMLTIIRFNKKEETANQRAFIACIGLLFLGIPFALSASRFNSLIYIPIAILAGSSIIFIKQKEQKYFIALFLISLMLLISFTLYWVSTTQIDPGINTGYQKGVAWITNNTPKNATFLSSIDDALAIQYYANRTTYIDPNYANAPSDIANYDNFLEANAYNFSFLSNIKPDYLIVRDNPGINLTVKNNIGLFNKHYAELNGSDNVSLALLYKDYNTTIYKVDIK